MANVLYVIELADTVSSVRGVPRRRNRFFPYVYVGYTGKRRDVRLREHRTGNRYFADRKWAPHYVRARRDLYRTTGEYVNQDAALDAERALRASLIRLGFTVVNKTGTPIAMEEQ